MMTPRHSYFGNPLPAMVRKFRRVSVKRHFYMVSPWLEPLKTLRGLGAFLVVSLIICSVVGGVIVGAGHLHYAGLAAQEDVTLISDLPERIEVCDSQGNHLGSIPWSTTRKSVRSLEEVSPVLVTALLRIEDRGFYKHGGVNWRGVARAVKHDFSTLSLQHGGSGITQQLAKLWQFGTPRDETVWEKFDRKFLEWHLAAHIERHFSKDEILVNYLNRFDFGGGFHGVYAAADGFFGKTPKDLTVVEAAVLVAIVRGPSLYSPILNPNACRARRNVVLRELKNAGHLTNAEAIRLAGIPLVTKHREWAASQKGSEEIRLAARELRAAGIPVEVLNKGGLKVTLTVDAKWDMQVAAATRAHVRRLDPGIPSRPLQAAALVIETETGAIKVLQTGRGDLPHDWMNRVFDGRQQVGSLAKPFLYRCAFERGLSPDKIMRNDEIGFGELWPGVGWSPRNSGHLGDRIPVRDGLIFSQNLVTVRIGAEVGLDAYSQSLEQLGVCEAGTVARTPTSFIGTYGSSVAQITRAFTIFSLSGRESPSPHIVAGVHHKDGKLVYSAPSMAFRVTDAASCQTTRECLAEIFTRGTARRAYQPGRQWIGKTGTTNGARDNWFVGSDPNFTCGVWIGCDKPTPLVGASGGAFALPLWTEIMRRAPSQNVSR